MPGYFLRRLWRAVKQFRLAIGLWFTLLMLSALFESVGLASVVPLLQMVLGEQDGRVLSIVRPWLAPIPAQYQPILLAAAAVGLIAAKQVLTIAAAFQSSRVVNRIRDVWRRRVMHHYLYDADPFSREFAHGVLLENAIQQPALASQLIAQILSFLRSAVFAVALVGMLLVLNWKLTLLATIVFLSGLGLGYYPLKQYADRLAAHNVKLLQELNAVGMENIVGVKTIRQFSREESRLSAFGSLSASQGRIAERYAIVNELPNTFGTLMIALIFMAGIAYLTLIEPEGVGEFVGVAIVAAYVGTRLNSYAVALSRNVVHIRQVLPSFNLVENLSPGDRDSKDERGVEIDFLRSDILIDHLTFSYESGRKVLDRVSMRIPRGQVTCIVGQSGIGKSTIAHILSGQIRAPAGAVMVNGHDLADCNLRSWRRRVAVVSQDIFLFDATVRENIAVGKPDASQREIETAARVAQAHDFTVCRLDNGYDTRVGSAGTSLSGGQRQRISIARAVIRDCDLYIFDEATNSLDAESRDAVLESIGILKEQGKTVVIITHDEDVVAQADRVEVIDPAPEVANRLALSR